MGFGGDNFCNNFTVFTEASAWYYVKNSEQKSHFPQYAFCFF